MRHLITVSRVLYRWRRISLGVVAVLFGLGVSLASQSGQAPASALTHSATTHQAAPRSGTTPVGAPTNIRSTPGNATATLIWSPPIGTPTSAITGYHITSSPAGFDCTTSTTTCSFSGLSNGTRYTFAIKAETDGGEGREGDCYVTPATIPGAPTNLVATGGNAQATLTWSAPVSNGGAAITTYTVTSSPTGAACTTAALTCHFTGLTNGTIYTLSVTARNSVGAGPAATATVTPATTPGAPLNVTATGGNATATVLWSPPISSGGSAITGYTVTSLPAGFTCTVTTTSCTFSGLTNGTRYTFSVVATNSVGNGPAGTASVTPATIPGAPTLLNVTGGNAQATLTWSAPVSNGGAAITTYTVTSTPVGASCSTAALTCHFTGLTNGTTYTLSVTARNSVGAGPAATTQVTPATTPGAPLNVTATGGNATATVLWSPPISTGGSVITGYSVTSSPAGFTCTVTTTSCTFSGLTNGTRYAFSVVATNAVGDGPAGSASVTPATLPTAPTNVSALGGNATATLTWSAPTSDGGAALTGYTVTAVPAGPSCTTLPTTTSCTFSGLTNGTSYTFSVAAINRVGTGPTASDTTTPATVPGAPTLVTATAGNQTATVLWSPPLSNGGAVITGYVVTSAPTGFTCAVSTTSCTFSGLTNGTTYTFTVTATNRVGTGNGTSATATPATVPDAPTNVAATSNNDSSSTITWSAPNSNGGAVVTSYTVAIAPSGSVPANCVATTALSCTVVGLTNGTTYTFTVTAANRVGSGAGASATGTPGTVPSAPLAPLATSYNDSSSVVTWLAPVNNGGYAALTYQVTVSPLVTSPAGLASLGTCAAVTTTSCTFAGLTNGTSYTFTIAASNVVGVGPSASATALPATVPSAPLNVTGIGANASAILHWTAPASTGGSPITGYTVTSSPLGLTCTSATTTCTVTGLTNEQNYTFSVTATNAAGTGPASVASLPVNVSATPITVSIAYYTAGLNQGGYQGTFNLTNAPAPQGNPYGTKAMPWTFTFVLPTGSTLSSIQGATATTIPTTDGTLVTVTAQSAFPVIPVGGNAQVNIYVAGSNAPTACNYHGLVCLTSPDAPTNLQGVGANTSALLTWTAPTNAAGGTIARYIVTAVGGAQNCISTTTSCTLGGLNNGQSYTFTVVAVNSNGAYSSPSLVSNVITAATTPQQAQQVSATAVSATSASVRWVAPSYNGGVPITSYIVTASNGAQVTSTTTSAQFTGLTPGASYTFTVVAVSAAGASQSSGQSNTIRTPLA